MQDMRYGQRESMFAKPGGRLVLTDGGNDRNMFLGVSGVQKRVESEAKEALKNSPPMARQKSVQKTDLPAHGMR